MDEDKANALLAQEYLQLQKTVEDFDARALTIKAWSITFSATGLGLAYQQGKPILLLIAAASAAVFWTIEGVWKVHQRAFYARIDAIEAHFIGEAAEARAKPFQISASWRASFRGDGNRLHSMLRMVPVFWQLGVVLPHILIVLAGIGLYLFHPHG
jgi:hypothetical protein